MTQDNSHLTDLERIRKLANKYELSSEQKKLLGELEQLIEKECDFDSQIVDFLISISKARSVLNPQDIEQVAMLQKKRFLLYMSRALVFAGLARIHTTKVMTKAGGYARHADTNVAKNWVQGKWIEQFSEYKGNKSAFARDYVGLVANNFKFKNGDPMKITERQIREVWLKDIPPAC
jgi:hypothetical protein